MTSSITDCYYGNASQRQSGSMEAFRIRKKCWFLRNICCFIGLKREHQLQDDAPPIHQITDTWYSSALLTQHAFLLWWPHDPSWPNPTRTRLPQPKEHKLKKENRFSLFGHGGPSVSTSDLNAFYPSRELQHRKLRDIFTAWTYAVISLIQLNSQSNAINNRLGAQRFRFVLPCLVINIVFYL